MITYLHNRAPIITSLVQHVFEHWRTLTCGAVEQNKGRATAYTCGKLNAERSLRLAGLVGVCFSKWAHMCIRRRVLDKSMRAWMQRSGTVTLRGVFTAWRRSFMQREAATSTRAHKLTTHLSTCLRTWRDECKAARSCRKVRIARWNTRMSLSHACMLACFGGWVGVVRMGAAWKTALLQWFGWNGVGVRGEASQWCGSVLRVIRMRARHVLR